MIRSPASSQTLIYVYKIDFGEHRDEMQAIRSISNILKGNDCFGKRYTIAEDILFSPLLIDKV